MSLLKSIAVSLPTITMTVISINRQIKNVIFFSFCNLANFKRLKCDDKMKLLPYILYTGHGTTCFELKFKQMPPYEMNVLVIFGFVLQRNIIIDYRDL